MSRFYYFFELALVLTLFLVSVSEAGRPCGCVSGISTTYAPATVSVRSYAPGPIVESREVYGTPEVVVYSTQKISTDVFGSSSQTIYLDETSSVSVPSVSEPTVPLVTERLVREKTDWSRPVESPPLPLVPLTYAAEPKSPESPVSLPSGSVYESAREKEEVKDEHVKTESSSTSKKETLVRRPAIPSSAPFEESEPVLDREKSSALPSFAAKTSSEIQPSRGAMNESGEVPSKSRRTILGQTSNGPLPGLSEALNHRPPLAVGPADPNLIPAKLVPVEVSDSTTGLPGDPSTSSLDFPPPSSKTPPGVPPKDNVPPNGIGGPSKNHFANGTLLIATIVSTMLLIYAVVIALDYRQRWMQSLISQNNRFSLSSDDDSLLGYTGFSSSLGDVDGSYYGNGLGRFGDYRRYSTDSFDVSGRYY